MKKIGILILLIISFCDGHSQRRMSISLSTGKSMQESYVDFIQGVFPSSYHISAFNVPRIDVKYHFQDQLNFSVGYSYLPSNKKESLKHESIMTLIPIQIGVDRKIVKGLQISLDVGLVIGSLKKGISVDTEIERHTSPLLSFDDSISFSETDVLQVSAKHQFTFAPTLGFQIQYRLFNDIVIFWSNSRVFGLGQKISERVKYRSFDGIDIKYNSTIFDFNQYWSKVGINIPIYNFDRNKKEK